MAPTAIVVPVPAASPATERWRRVYTGDGADGMPPHVTLVHPFADDDRLSEAEVEEVRRVVGAFPPFEFALERFETFPAAGDSPPVLYLAPSPAEPFRELTEALARAFPAWPPYGGAYADVVPHVTVASHVDAPTDEIRIAIEPVLPLLERAEEAWVVHRPEGRWRMRSRVPLGSSR